MSQHSVVFRMFIDSQRAVLTMQWHQTQTKCIAHAQVEWKRSLTAHTRVTDSRTQVKSSSFDWPGLRMCRNGHRRNLTAHARIAISEHREWTQVKSSSRLDWTLETLEGHIGHNWHITVTINCTDWKFIYFKATKGYLILWHNLRILDSSKIIQCGTSIRQFWRKIR